jgi:hypothetical protein
MQGDPPSRGRKTCLVSARIAPVVTRTEGLARCLDVNWGGNPTGAPLRLSDRESPPFFRRPRQPIQTGIGSLL